MNIVCGFTWGIWWWRTSSTNIRVADYLANLASLDNCINDMALLKSAGVEKVRRGGIDRGIPENVPLDLVSAEKAKHQSSKDYRRHLWTSPLMPGVLSLVRKDTYVFTPVMCLLQVAAGITKALKGTIDARFYVVIVAQLGCELCGQYSLTKDGFACRIPLTNTGEIARAILAAEGLRGVWVLRQAFPWMLDNLRSPKETALYLLICLPPELGGFGLPRPLSNYDIDVSLVGAGPFATWTTCNVDFYWGQARLVVEYDSKQFHNDPDKCRRDALRADALRALGYTVITVTYTDLYDVKRLRKKAGEIAAALGTSLPDVTPEFIDVNNILRAILLRHDRWI